MLEAIIFSIGTYSVKSLEDRGEYYCADIVAGAMLAAPIEIFIKKGDTVVAYGKSQLAACELLRNAQRIQLCAYKQLHQDVLFLKER